MAHSVQAVNLGRALPGDTPDEGLGDFAVPDSCTSCAEDKGLLAAYGCFRSMSLVTNRCLHDVDLKSLSYE